MKKNKDPNKVSNFKNDCLRRLSYRESAIGDSGGSMLETYETLKMTF